MLTYTLENNKIVVKDTEEVKSETITLDEFLNEEFENLTGTSLVEELATKFLADSDKFSVLDEDVVSSKINQYLVI